MTTSKITLLHDHFTFNATLNDIDQKEIKGIQDLKISYGQIFENCKTANMYLGKQWNASEFGTDLWVYT